MTAVYFIACDSAAAVKIGVAVDVPRRLAQLQAASPTPLRLVATIPGGFDIEARLHRAASAHRRSGEWFDAHPDVITMLEKATMGEIPPKPAQPEKLGRGRRRNPKHPIDRGAPASVIADKFGGLKAFADALELSMSTVHRWLVRGSIDAKYHDAVFAAAKRRNVRLKPADFVDTRSPEDRASAAVPELAAAGA